MTSANPVPLVAKADIDFTYSVVWVPTEKPFARRFERYLDFHFFQHQVHWLSIFNSFMMVLFLTGAVSELCGRGGWRANSNRRDCKFQ